MVERTIIVAGGLLLGSLMCHQRLKRRGQEITHTRAKLTLVGLNLVVCGFLVHVFG